MPLLPCTPHAHPAHQYDGEKDQCTPSDFTGTAPSSKLDDLGEPDDDDPDDNDNPEPRAPKRSGKLKAEFKPPPPLNTDMAMNLDVRTPS